MRTWILIWVMGLIALSAVVASEHKVVVLTDFEDEPELARFALKGTEKSAVSLATEPAGHGAKAARIVFPKWKPGAEEWPAIMLTTAKGLPPDWSGFDCLALDVRNASKTDADVGLHIRDAGGQSVGKHFIIAPGERQTIRYQLAEAGAVDFTRVRELHIFGTRPPADVALIVDYLRLEEDLGSRLAAAEQRLSGLRRQPRPQECDRMFAKLGGELANLLARAASESSVVAREMLRIEVLAFTKTLDTDVPRLLSEARMRAEFRRIDPKLPYACGFATSMEKVFPADVPFRARVTRQAGIELAGNEIESLQLLILAGDQSLDGVQVRITPLMRADGDSSRRTPSARVSPVGFVQTKKPPYHAPYIGWYPDPILDSLTRFDVKSNEMQPVWIRVSTPPGAMAGDYRATITVQPSNAPPVELGLRVTVWGFDVPEERHLRTALNFSPAFVEQAYGERSEKRRLQYYDFLLEYRLNPDSIYRADPPALTDLLRWNRAGMNAFNMIYVRKPVDHKSGAPYPEADKARILAQLDAVVPQLKANGLYEKAYVYGFDEVSADTFNAMKDVFSTIKAKYPDLPLMTTAYDATYGESTGLDMVDAWVPLTPSYNLERARNAREEGKQVWWYICIVPKSPYANWLIEYDAIDARSLMGLQSAKYQPDGFLYYATNRWPLTKKPITDGPYTDWPPRSFQDCNGDGSLMCAGPDGPLATIRLENLRDGIEDYEYFWLLRQEIIRLRSNRAPRASEVLRAAEVALKISDGLVKSLSSFSKSPDAIYAKRRQVAEAILQAREVP